MHKINVSLYHKEWQFSCHLTTGRNVQHLSLENFLPQIVYCTKIRVSFYHIGRQFSCHHITGRNTKHLSLKKCLTADCLLHKKMEVYTIRGGSLAATILQVEILRTYHRKMSYRRLFIAQKQKQNKIP